MPRSCLIWGPKALPFPVPYGLPLEIGNLSLPMSFVWIVIAAVVGSFGSLPGAVLGGPLVGVVESLGVEAKVKA